jgi:hypothetical protein
MAEDKMALLEVLRKGLCGGKTSRGVDLRS